MDIRLKLFYAELKKDGVIQKLKKEMEETTASQLPGVEDRDQAYNLALQMRANNAFFNSLDQMFSN